MIRGLTPRISSSSGVLFARFDLDRLCATFVFFVTLWWIALKFIQVRKKQHLHKRAPLKKTQRTLRSHRESDKSQMENDKCTGIGLESKPVDYDHVFKTTSNQTPPNGAASATRLSARCGGQRRFPLDKLLNLAAKTG
jgi:hypothetical protein